MEAERKLDNENRCQLIALALPLRIHRAALGGCQELASMI